MKVYISGKISGLDFEEVRVKFAEAEEFLNSLGLEAVNPLKNGLSVDDAWIKHLCRDIEILNDCDSIYMMDGWQGSVGACVEYDFAIRTGKTILFASNIMRNQAIISTVESAVHEATGLRLSQYNIKGRRLREYFARMIFSYQCKVRGMTIENISECLQRDCYLVRKMLSNYNNELKFNALFRSMAKRVEEIFNITNK